MNLQGLHHITMITGDAQANVDFYAGKLGLRLVKKTVNFDSPDAYHLYFGDESGTPGTILTWFEFPGARRGRAGAGMIHTIQLGVASEDALDFWAERLGVERTNPLRFADNDGLNYELHVSGAEPKRAVASGDPGGVRDHRHRRRARLRAAGPARRADRDAGLRRTGRRLHARRLHLGLRRAAGRSAASSAPGPSITSPGPRATRTTSPGSSVSPRPASA